jgi:hypothetical protein
MAGHDVTETERQGAGVSRVAYLVLALAFVSMFVAPWAFYRLASWVAMPVLAVGVLIGCAYAVRLFIKSRPQ